MAAPEDWTSPEEQPDPEEQPPAEPEETGPTAEELPEWAIFIDTSSTDPYLPAEAASATIAGQVVAPASLSRFTVAGDAVLPNGAGQFDADVPVTAGLNIIELEASDLSEPANERRTNTAVLAADYLPEGELNSSAAALALTDAVVGPLAAPMQPLVRDIDVAAEILARPVLTDDGTCTTYPTSATQGTPRLRLFVGEDGGLWLEVLIPQVRIDFYGHCSTFIMDTDITGDMETEIAILSRLSAPPGEDCLVGLDHSPAEVELRDFDLDVQGGSGLLDSLVVMIMGEISEGDSAETLREEIAVEAESMLGPELEDITIFESSEVMDLLGTPMTLDLCVTGLVTSNSTLLALVGARVEGDGAAVNDAPGVPMTPGELPDPQPGSFYLDANLVGQLVYSAWRSGALLGEDISQTPYALLSLVCRDLEGLFPEDSMIDVSIDGRLAPMARAVESGPGDLVLELGNFVLGLEVEGELLARVGTQLGLVLDLQPEGAGLRPVVASVTTETFVIEEPMVDIDDEVLTSAIDLQMSSTAADLLGDAIIALPSIGDAPMTPVDAEPVPGGRYVRVVLE